MNTEAIFADGTREYRNPWEPAPYARVRLRVRVGHGAETQVGLVTPQYTLPMQLDESGDVFDYYRVEIQLGKDPFSYIYRIEQDGETVWYDSYGITDGTRWNYAFHIIPGFTVPDWMKGAVIYQIFVDRFCNGDPDNDVVDGEYAYLGRKVEHVDDWNSMPHCFDVGRFYGGDLEGVRQKLTYLKNLGVEVIYFNPLFLSPSNHKYDAQDYEHIDPHFGVIAIDRGEPLSEQDYDNHNATLYRTRTTHPNNLDATDDFFAQFVREAHEKGIRVILDGVFNHCGSFHRWMDREGIYAKAPKRLAGAYNSAHSPYRKYFAFGKREDGDWPNNGSYEQWWGNETLPKLNYEGSEELCEYILSIGQKWVSEPYCCDGWRLDVAADLGHSEEFNHEFWRRFRVAVKEANPEAVILAEHYGDAFTWLAGDQWDTIMNYDGFMEPVSWFLTGMEKHSEAFDEHALSDGERFEAAMRSARTRMMTPSRMTAMNQLSNHDHSRFMTRTNHRVGRINDAGCEAANIGINRMVMKAGVVIQMTWPGAPTLYYGDEAGLCGFTDPDNRRPYPWGHEDRELIDFHREIISIHRRSRAIRIGSCIFLACGRNVISYARFTRDEQVITVVNSGDCTIDVTIPVWKAEIPMDCSLEQVMVTTEHGYSIMPVYHEVKNGMLRIQLRPFGSVVLQRS